MGAAAGRWRCEIRVQQIGPAEVVHGAEHAGEHPQGLRVIAAQELGQGGEREAGRRGVLDDPQSGQAPQQPEQAFGIDVAGRRQLLGAPLTGRQLIGHPEFGGYLNHRGHPGAAGHRQQRIGRSEGRRAGICIGGGARRRGGRAGGGRTGGRGSQGGGRERLLLDQRQNAGLGLGGLAAGASSRAGVRV